MKASLPIALLLAVAVSTPGVDLCHAASDASEKGGQETQSVVKKAPIPAGELAVAAAPDAPVQKNEHFAKVVSTFNSDGYTYIEYAEGDEISWVASMKAAISVGDIIRFPHSDPMTDFVKKGSGKTFKKIIFAPIFTVIDKNSNRLNTPSLELNYIAQHLHYAGWDEQALQAVNSAIDQDIKSRQFYKTRADIKKSMARKDITNSNTLYYSAIDDIKTAIYLSDSTYDRYIIGLYYLELGDLLSGRKGSKLTKYQEALSYYDKAIEISNQNPMAYSSKGSLLKKMKDYTKMPECAIKLIRLSPDDCDGYYLYANYYLGTKQYSKALKYIEDGIKYDNYFIGSDELVEFAASSKMYDAAIAVLNKWIQKKPEADELYASRSVIHKLKGNTKNAIYDITTAINFNRFAYYLELRSILYASANKKKEALADAKEACSLGSEESCERAKFFEGNLLRGEQWKYIASDKHHNWYSDSTAKINKGNPRSIWLRVELKDKELFLKDPDISEEERKYTPNTSYTLARFDFDCSNRRFKAGSEYMYSESGSVVQSNTQPGSFTETVPGSVAEVLWMSVCKENSPITRNSHRKRAQNK